MMFKKDVMGFGGLKVISDRAATYANRVLTILNLILLINLNSLAGADLMQYLWLGILSFMAFILLLVFDLVVIYPSEINFRDIRSSVMGDMHTKLDLLVADMEKRNKEGLK